MPAIPLTQPARKDGVQIANPLPQMLHTPSGLALIEIQGSVLSDHSQVDPLAQAISLGRLVFPPADDSSGSTEWDGKRVLLFVGKHQRAQGAVVKLQHAIAVVGRQTQPTAKGSFVEIVEIVQYKMIFKHRPEPMGAGQSVGGLDPNSAGRSGTGGDVEMAG